MGNITPGLNRFCVVYIGDEMHSIYDVDKLDNLHNWRYLMDEAPECSQLIRDLRQLWQQTPTVFLINSELSFDILQSYFHEYPLEMRTKVLETGEKIL